MKSINLGVWCVYFSSHLNWLSTNRRRTSWLVIIKGTGRKVVPWELEAVCPKCRWMYQTDRKMNTYSLLLGRQEVNGWNYRSCGEKGRVGRMYTYSTPVFCEMPRTIVCCTCGSVCQIPEWWTQTFAKSTGTSSSLQRRLGIGYNLPPVLPLEATKFMGLCTREHMGIHSTP